jgi:hypothetical protein
MNPNETQVAEEAVVQIMRATRVADAESGPARHSQQTDQCPKISRFAAVYKHGGKWTPAEDAHVAKCAFCQKVLDMFASAMSKVAQAETHSEAKSKAEEETFRDMNVKKPGTPGAGDEPKPG